MQRNDLDNMTPDRALATARILWAALIVGQVIFLGVVASLQGGQAGPTLGNPQSLDLLMYIVIGMVAVCVPVGYIGRMQVYKRHWQDEVITPKGYITGNLVLWAMCEGPGLMGLVLVMLAGDFWPWILPTAAAMAVMVLNYPDGRPMRPAAGRYDQRHDDE